MSRLWKCPCGGLNGSTDRLCGACGSSRTGTESLEPAASTTRRRTACDCGGPLLASGACERTGGYPATSSCQLACPICRGLLAWDGGCERCHGCTTGQRADWTFPGDRYDLDKGHCQRVDGPRKACTAAENAAGFAAVRAVLGTVEYLSATRSPIPDVDPAIRAEVARRSDEPQRLADLLAARRTA